ncbi:MAG: GMC family oxidoreductase [Deltaproteobacteria bacterium]|nr:GMC family oxidoreductase [Deltaproteobacteria bacterium]
MDVLVVGGGLSGVLVAEHLAAHGVRAAIFEAGPKLERRLPSCDRAGFDRAIQPLLEIDSAAWAYRSHGAPFDWLRVRAGGGRSLLWGGWCARLDEQNLRDAKAFGAPWPFSPGDLDHHYHRVERRLGLRAVEVPEALGAISRNLGLEVAPKLCAPGPCGCRAAVSLDWLRHASFSSNAVALRVLFDARGRAAGLEIADAVTRETKAIKGRAIVLCASPIETARLLLMSAPGGPAGAQGLIGKGLSDHLVASYLLILPRPAPMPGVPGPLERAAVVPRFVNRGRKQRRDYRGGFTIEVRGPMAIEPLGPEVLHALGIELADSASLSQIQVHVIGEARPNPSRFVSLDDERKDTFGRPLPVIHFAFDDEDAKLARDMDEAGLAVAQALAVPGSRIIPFRAPLTTGGAGHEAGTCAMGRNAARHPIDLSGAVRGVPGLYVADASLLPTGLDRYPTLTVLALALNVADGMIESASRGEI